MFVLCSSLSVLTFVMFCSPRWASVAFVIMTVSIGLEDLALTTTSITTSQHLVVVLNADF